MEALSENRRLYEIRCQACGFVEPVTSAGMFEFLRKRRRIHAGSDATPEIIAELFLHFVPKSCCPGCRHPRLTAVPLKRAASRKTTPVATPPAAKTPAAEPGVAKKTAGKAKTAEKTPVESVKGKAAGKTPAGKTAVGKGKKQNSAACDDGGDAAWADIDPVLCEDCGRPIPPERLAIVPETTVCVQCKQARERDGIQGDSWVSGYDPQGSEEDFCLRCGAPMRLRTTTGERITRYVSVCSAGCRPRA